MSIPPSHRVRFTAPVRRGTPLERLAATCDMHGVAIAQLVARVRRERPGISEAEVDAAVTAWLAGGDPGPGRPRTIAG